MFLPIHAKENQTIEALKQKISSFNRLDSDYLDDIFVNGSSDEDEVMPISQIAYDCDTVAVDLKSIDVDCENCDPIGEYRMPGTEGMKPFEVLSSNIPVMWCACGGDWQMPLAFVLYIGEDDNLHAYIPDMGNAYDHQNQCAYEDADDDTYVFNPTELRLDVENALKPSDESISP